MEEDQVQRTGHRLLQAGLEGKVYCGVIALQSLECTGHHRNGEEKSHQELHRGSGESLEIALDKERRSMWRNRCHLNTSRGLINLDWVAWARVSDVERPETPNDPRIHH